MLLGQNEVKQDVASALDLSSSCAHPDAIWLCEVSNGRNVSSWEDARSLFLNCQPDARALCFASLVHSGHCDDVLLRRSADLGFAFAQAWMTWRTKADERFNYAQRSAAAGERDGFYSLAYCFQLGEGCGINLDEAKENLVVAAQFGMVHGMDCYGMCLNVSDAQHWVWLGRAAAHGCSYYFVSNFLSHFEKFYAGSYADVVFAIGYALKGRLEAEKGEVFGRRFYNDRLPDLANKAINFYNAEVVACRRAIDTWTLVGIQFGVVKDIRIMIGKRVWESRVLALYSTRSIAEVPSVQEMQFAVQISEEHDVISRERELIRKSRYCSWFSFCFASKKGAY